MQLMEGLVLNRAATMVEKYHSCHNSQEDWLNEQTKYSLRCYSGVTVWLGWCLIAPLSHLLPCLRRVAAVEQAVGCESVFLEKSVPVWYWGNPDLSLHRFYLILCLETSFIVFVSLQNNLRFSWQWSRLVLLLTATYKVWAVPTSTAHTAPRAAGELTHLTPWKQGGVRNPGGRGRGA